MTGTTMKGTVMKGTAMKGPAMKCPTRNSTLLKVRRMQGVMQHALQLLSCLVLLGGSATALAEPQLQPFNADSLQRIEAQQQGAAFLLVLWSVTCAPCFAELALLSEALVAEPELPIVLVSTDAPQLGPEVEATLADYGLAAHAGWQFAGDMPEKLRFHIDPAWYGELPRSYFYDATQQRSGHSGALTRAQLEHWLRTRTAPAAGPAAAHH